MRHINILLLIILYSCCANANSMKPNTLPEKAVVEECVQEFNKNFLQNGWYLWEPYQYNKMNVGGYKLAGMDVELVQNIAKKVGIDVRYEQVSWKKHQKDLKTGVRDIAAGATYTDDRSKHMHFSDAYRYEENSLFMLSDSNIDLDFDNVSEFLAQVRLQNFRVGVTDGFIYADPQINIFISDSMNADIIRTYQNNIEALQALISGEIDGFVADRVVGAAAILNNSVNNIVTEVKLEAKTPIHLMFSKKTVPLEVVERFNVAIKDFKDSSKYKTIVKKHVYPVILLQTIDSNWFYFIGIIGTIAFAISGIAIAAKDNATLFATFLFAMLPSVGGGIMRDVLINRESVGLFLTPSYMYYIIVTVLIGFFLVRFLDYYNKDAKKDSMLIKFWDHTLILGDALGQAAFIVTGVSITIMARIEPIGLWGPFFAFITANGGGIMRDLLRKKHKITCLAGSINAEISILWGAVFGIYLDITSHSPDPDGIKNAVIVTALGAFVTRLIVFYYKVPNLKFR